MEDTLREFKAQMNVSRVDGLNPYSNGRYSERRRLLVLPNRLVTVLILILMEDTLRE